VSFINILYDPLYLVDNRITKNHHFVQCNNCVDTARGNPSRVKLCHEVAEAMFLDGFLEQMPSMTKCSSLSLEDCITYFDSCCMCDVMYV
jgi:hypothetical protein